MAVKYAEAPRGGPATGRGVTWEHGSKVVQRRHELRLIEPSAARRRKSAAFSLIELLVVIAIITVLLAILAPTLGRVSYLTRSAICGSDKHQVAVGLTNYAAANNGYYPARWPQASTYNHAYWFGKPNSRDLHEQFEKYLGKPRDDGPPAMLLCAVAPTGIWGVKLTWPYIGIYRTNVSVYAGYDWSTASANACVPQAPLDQMPQKQGQAPQRPVAGDLIEYMSGNSSQGYSGWDTPHSSDPRYHFRGPDGPEDPPPDPIPFVYGDGSVRFTRDLDPCYTDPGWGTNYWPTPQ